LIDNAADGRYWVAEKNDQIIGQIMVTCECSDWRKNNLTSPDPDFT